MDRLLTIRKLAGRLSIPPGTAYHWLSESRLSCFRFSARCVRFREGDAEKLLEQLKQAAPRDLSMRKPYRSGPRGFMAGDTTEATEEAVTSLSVDLDVSGPDWA
jgi:hypothetical protein